MTETREPYNGEPAPLSTREAFTLAMDHWRLLSTARRGADTIETADDGEADAYRQCKVALARMPLGIN
jgi:hypothetical protein